MSASHELDSRLEQLVLQELREQWGHLNWSLFGERMQPPVLALSDATAVLARFVAGTRTIEVTRRLVRDHAWAQVIEVFKHEMAHQYVSEVVRADETSHGPVFRDVCRARGIDARAAGVITTPDADAASTATGRVIDKVQRLLALAGSDNPHEAEAAMQQARRLMLEHNIRDRDTHAEERDFTFAHVGSVKARHDEHEAVLGSILTKHFFVQAIWISSYRPLEGRAGTVLEICGTQANVRMAEYVHSFLARAGEAAWKRHRDEHGIGGNRDRRTFLVGVMRGFAEKLERERQASTAKGLVWVGDAGVEAYYRRRHPQVRMEKRAGRRRTEAFAHGQTAGRELVLHRPIEGSGGGGGGLLSSGE